MVCDKSKSINKTYHINRDCHCEECASTTKQSTAGYLQRIAALPAVARNDIKCVAFTLAEVLITLTIIGVIAALTIPNLSKKWSDHADTAKVKQVYSILDNAFKSMLREENASDLTDINWPNNNANANDKANANFLLEKLSEQIKFSKLCYSANGCAPESYYYKTLHGEEKYGSWPDYETAGKAILANGMTLAITVWSPAGVRANLGELSNYAGSIRVDINGKKGPNQWGYDVFAFPFNRYGLMRKGITSDYCVDINPYYWSGCTEWILKKENMDYKYLSDEEIKKQW